MKKLLLLFLLPSLALAGPVRLQTTSGHCDTAVANNSTCPINVPSITAGSSLYYDQRVGSGPTGNAPTGTADTWILYSAPGFTNPLTDAAGNKHYLWYVKSAVGSSSPVTFQNTLSSGTNTMRTIFVEVGGSYALAPIAQAVSVAPTQLAGVSNSGNFYVNVAGELLLNFAETDDSVAHTAFGPWTIREVAPPAPSSKISLEDQPASIIGNYVGQTTFSQSEIYSQFTLGITSVATPTPTASPSPTASPVPTTSPSPTTSPTPTPTPSPSPTPTPLPQCVVSGDNPTRAYWDSYSGSGTYLKLWWGPYHGGPYTHSSLILTPPVTSSVVPTSPGNNYMILIAYSNTDQPSNPSNEIGCFNGVATRTTAPTAEELLAHPPIVPLNIPSRLWLTR